MPNERVKALRLRRAAYHGAASKKNVHGGNSLETYLHALHLKYKTVSARQATFEGGFILEMRSVRKRKNVGTLLHLAAYTEKEEASVVPRVGEDAEDAPVGTAPPPRNADYMDGDLMLLIAGNDVVLCSNSLTERKLEWYCSSMFAKAEFEPIASMFTLRPVADANKLALIENEGVKEIVLDATAFESEVGKVRKHSVRRTVSDGIATIFENLFAEDPSLSELSEKENLSAEVVFKFDSRKKGGKIGKQQISEVAKKLIEEDPDGFKIKTMKGTELSHDSVSLQKKVKILADGKSVQRDATFQELVEYYQELKDAGHVDE